MAGFQTTSMMIPDHPVLYGTTLAISLVGSVAALSSGGVAVPLAKFESALGLVENASAAVTSGAVLNAAEPEAPSASAAPDQTEVPAANAPAGMSVVPAERSLSAMPPALEAAQPIAEPKLTKADLAPQLQPEIKSAPEAVSAPALAALQAPWQDPPIAPATNAELAPQPSQSFAGAFEVIPAPSLAVAAERQDEVRGDGATSSAALALTAAPDQGLTDQQKVVAAPVPAVSPSKLVEVPLAPVSTVQTIARASETAVVRDQRASKLTVPSASVQTAASPQMAEAKSAPPAQPLRLISTPQLRKFDLARIHVQPRAPTASLAPPTAKPGQAGKVRSVGAKDKLVEGVVFHRVTVTVAGSPAKSLDVRIGADMKPSIKVGDLLGLVSDRMDPANAARFASAASAEEYVSLAALRAAGLNVSYNAGTDSISINSAD